MERTKHIGGIDLIRAAAALLVATFHLCFWQNQPYGTSQLFSAHSAPFPELDQFTNFGFVGVQIFFVISGFVIAFSARGKTAKQYLASRCWRLIPTIAMCAFVGFAVLAVLHLSIGDTSPIILLLKTLMLYPAPPWVDGVYWTLVVEVQFYLIVLVMLLFASDKYFEWLAWALVSLSATYLWLSMHGMVRPISNVYIPRFASYFALGIAFWLIWGDGINFRRGLLVGFAMICAWFELKTLYRDVAIQAICTWALGMIAIIAALKFEFRGSRSMRTIGLMTFPFYLLHDVVGASLLRLAPETGRYQALAIAFAVVIALSWTVYWLDQLVRPTVAALAAAKSEQVEAQAKS